jgi:hypothetical protein
MFDTAVARGNDSICARKSAEARFDLTTICLDDIARDPLAPYLANDGRTSTTALLAATSPRLSMLVHCAVRAMPDAVSTPISKHCSDLRAEALCHSYMKTT